MKKIILFATLFTFATLSSFAQFRIGPEAGVTISSAQYSEPVFSVGGYTYSYSTSFIVGGKAGVIADIPLMNVLYLQPGMFYSMKGYDINYTYSDGSYLDGRMRVSYIEMPVNLIYKTGTEGSGRFFAGAGPYLGVAIHGNVNVSMGGAGIIYPFELDQSLTIGNSGFSMIKRLDIGAGANLGYEMPFGMFFRGQFQYGFFNTSPQAQVTQRIFGGSVSIGYLF